MLRKSSLFGALSKVFVDLFVGKIRWVGFLGGPSVFLLKKDNFTKNSVLFFSFAK
jgi:hypothetical protein